VSFMDDENEDIRYFERKRGFVQAMFFTMLNSGEEVGTKKKHQKTLRDSIAKGTRLDGNYGGRPTGETWGG